MKPLSFDGTASSLCYLITPFATVPETISLFREAFEKAHERYGSAHPEHDISGFSLNSYLMCGECDLLFEITHDNFRFTHYLQNELTPLASLRASWFHLAKYQSESAVAPEVEQDALLFQVFLKLGIHPYRDPEGTPAQFAQLLGSRLHKLIESARDFGFFLDLYTTIGWADCVLSGRFTGSIEDHHQFFRQLESIGYEVGEEQRSFHHRRVTLLGLPLAQGTDGIVKVPKYKDSHRVFSPLVIARVQPGRMPDARKTLFGYITDMGSRDPGPLLSTVDGKWDIVWQAGLETLPLPKIRDAIVNQVLERDTATLARHEPSIEQIETHLLPFPVSDDTKIEDILAKYPEEHRRDAESPRGARLVRRIADTWSKVRRLKIASPLLNEISSHLSLFSTLAKDNDNRVMIDYVIHGSLESLLHLIVHLEHVSDTILWFEKHQNVPSGEQEESLATRYRSVDLSYSELQHYLRNWCDFVGKTLRQRVVGSFENLFDRAVTAPAMRGTLQKMLFVMDGLLREFYGTLPPSLTKIEQGDAPERPPRLASVFTPTTLIQSQRYLELVEIPSKYSFSPHQVLPQLWHEVGQCVFFRRFNPFDSPLLSRMRSDDGIEYQRAFRRIGDHFADLLVLVFGFQNRFNLFARYLTRSILLTEHELMVFGDARDRVNTRRRDALLQEIKGRLWILARHVGQEEVNRQIDLVEIASEYFAELFPPDLPVPEIVLPPYCNNDRFLSYVKVPMDLITKEAVAGSGLWDISSYASCHGGMLESLERGEIYDLSACDCSKCAFRCDCESQVLVNELFLHFYELYLSKHPLTFQQLSALGFTALQSFRNSSPAFERGVEVRDARTSLRAGKKLENESVKPEQIA